MYRAFKEKSLMDLDNTLQLLALQVPVNPDELLKFAAEDSVGGWDLDKGGWPIGSLWSVEGKVLYALIRALHPDKVVEVGTHRGCSTTHIATALEVNGQGEVISLDLAPGVGDLIPRNLTGRVSLIAASGVIWLAEQPDESIDIIYEDADHSAETSRDVALLAVRKLKPGGLHIVHDAAHDYAWLGDGSQIHSDVGATIRRGLEAALGDQFRVYRTDPSDCGFALWQKPDAIKTDVHSTPTIVNHNELPNGAPSNEALSAAINKLRETGAIPITVQSEAGDPVTSQEVPAVQEDEPVAQDDDSQPIGALEYWTKAQLEDYAKANDINLTGARTKADIIDRISAHETDEDA
jgi:predicted O-methyltransferase YrrM